MIPFGLGFLSVALLAHGVTSMAAGDVDRCSIIPLPSARDANITYLLGIAADDTVVAGPGSVEPSGGPGHWGDGRERAIYGQAVRVDRFGGGDSTMLARAFEQQSANRAVIVPWDYDASCRTTYWSRSARWVVRGEPGVYTVRMRAQDQWVDSLPTFDAFMADTQPYPHGRLFQRNDWRADSPGSGPPLTAAEYFELYRELPDRNTVAQSPEAASAAATRWEQANPELASRHPADAILKFVRSHIRSAITRRHLRSIVPPVGGTYRFSFSLTGREDRTFYARTRAVPTSAWSVRPRQPAADPRDPPPRPEGYYMLTSGAMTLDSLPVDCERSRQIGREGYVSVLDPPQSPGEVRREWVGSIELSLLVRQFPADSVLRQFAREQFDRFSQRHRQNLPTETPARFIREQDGSVRVQQTVRLDDGRAVVIRGQRISQQTISCS